jgi:hypothetical protein
MIVSKSSHGNMREEQPTIVSLKDQSAMLAATLREME